MIFSFPLRGTACIALSVLAYTTPCAADEPEADSKVAPAFTAHIDLYSRYYVRGITKTYGNGAPLGNAFADAPESDRLTPQWGLDYVHPSGLYVGYWASLVNYSYKQLGKSYEDRAITDFQANKSIENDLYGGYTGSVGDVSYTVGGTYYYYYNGVASNGFESKLGLAYGAFGINAQTLLQDVTWGNRGDTYWTATFSQPLPYNITLNTSLGYYTYRKEGKYLGTRDTLAGTDCATGTAFVVNGCFAGAGPASSALRHLIVGLTLPIASTGVILGVQGIIGGRNRFGISQSNRVAASVSYGY